MTNMAENRERVFECWQALRAACLKQHPGGPGGSAMCICGAGGGGSSACSGLKMVRVLLSVATVPENYREMLEDLATVINAK